MPCILLDEYIRKEEVLNQYSTFSPQGSRITNEIQIGRKKEVIRSRAALKNI